MDDLRQKRVSKQPLEYPSAGSTFKRPEGYFAGKLIQDSGLKGFTVGGAQVSEKHSGFVVIVTGMSGAGKSTTLKMMEDMGYFCVDNMPIPLMTKLTELLIVPNGEITKIALGLDIRSGQNLRALDQVLDELEKTKIPLEILFLESNDDTLVKRYKETRRNHPLSKGGRIENGIAK